MSELIPITPVPALREEDYELNRAYLSPAQCIWDKDGIVINIRVDEPQIEVWHDGGKDGDFIYQILYTHYKLRQIACGVSMSTPIGVTAAVGEQFRGEGKRSMKSQCGTTSRRQEEQHNQPT